MKKLYHGQLETFTEELILPATGAINSVAEENERSQPSKRHVQSAAAIQPGCLPRAEPESVRQRTPAAP